MKFRVLARKFWHRGACYLKGAELESVTDMVQKHGEDLFEYLDDIPAEKMTRTHPITEEEAVQVKIVHKGGGRWVVINTVTGTQLNDGYLKKDEAEHLAETLKGAVPTEEENGD